MVRKCTVRSDTALLMTPNLNKRYGADFFTTVILTSDGYCFE